MSASPRSYRSIEEFEREEIRPNYRIGFSLEDLVEESAFEAELDFDPDRDDLEAREAELDADDEDEDDDEF